MRINVMAITKMFYDSVERRFSDDNVLASYEVIDPSLVVSLRPRAAERFHQFGTVFPGFEIDPLALSDFLCFVHDDECLATYEAGKQITSVCATKYPHWTSHARRILLCPTSTAHVERSFSTLNYVVRSDRKALTDLNIDCLIRLAASEIDTTDSDYDQYIQWLIAHYRLTR